MSVVAAGLSEPTSTTVGRRPGSVRRTSDIMMVTYGAEALALAGRARDLRTNDSGRPEVLSEAAVRARLDENRLLEYIETMPHDDGVQQLVGLRVASGFRSAVQRSVPAHHNCRSALYLLLDDLPVAALISGYARLSAEDRGDQAERAASPARSVTGELARDLRSRIDICSGWRSDGTMMAAVRTNGRAPVTLGPVAPPLEDPEDPLGWHEMEPLTPGAMRRRRLIDVAAGTPLIVRAMFRDSYADVNRTETVLHEYTLDLEVDPLTLVVVHSEATPRVLPWPECPAAAASARRLEGHKVGELREIVRDEFKGTSTCTHLNDLLRCVSDVETLAAAL